MDTENKINHLKFTKDVFWVGLSSFIISLFGIITLPALTKNYSTDLYGVWSQMSVTVSLVSPILTLQLGTACVRFFAGEDHPKKLSLAYSNMMIPIILMVLVSLFISLTIPDYLSKILFENEKYAYFIPLTFIWAGTSAIFAFQTSFLRTLGKIKKLSIIRFISTFLKAIALVILAIYGFSMTDIVISQILVDTIFIVSVYLDIIKKIGFSFPNLLNLKSYLSLSLPDIPSGIILWILNSIDRFFIIQYLGLTQAAIYSASYGIGSILGVFYTPISFVLFPFLSRFWVKNDIKSVKLYLEYSLKFFLAFSIPTAVGLYALSNSMLSILATSQYAIGGMLILLISIGTIFLGIYQINIYIIYLEKKTKWTPVMISASAFINIILNIILIPIIGIYGAAIATIGSYLILAIIVTLWVRKSIAYSIDLRFLLKVLLGTFFMGLVLSLVNLLGLNISEVIKTLINIIIGILTYFICIFIFKIFTKNEKTLIKGILKNFIGK